MSYCYSQLYVHVFNSIIFMLNKIKTYTKHNFFFQFQLSNDPSPGYNIEQLAKKYVIHSDFKYTIKLEMFIQFM